MAEHKDLWDVHHDPYDITRIWARNHQGGGWITCMWKHLHTAPAPFGELAWNHARDRLRDGGHDAGEDEIAAEAAALLERAHRGPDTGGGGSRIDKRARKVVAATAATGPSLSAMPTAPAIGPQTPAREGDDDDGEPLAEVVPLPIFDARAEAERWW